MPQSFTGLYFHLIFSTKHRAPLIADVWASRLYDYIGGIIHQHKGIMLAIGGMPDHIHLLVTLPKNLAIADVLRLIKANSSLWIHRTFDEKKTFAWQGGYGAFTVSASNVEQVCRYIANQREHHRQKTFQEEFVEFLKAYNVAYEEGYLWEE